MMSNQLLQDETSSNDCAMSDMDAPSVAAAAVVVHVQIGITSSTADLEQLQAAWQIYFMPQQQCCGPEEVMINYSKPVR